MSEDPELQQKHKPILEQIQKVLKAGEEATEEDIKALQKGLKDNELLKNNKDLHTAFVKEAFENDQETGKM